jgi:chemotaxis protein CheY-P-specific phosphatase CheC
MNKFVKSGSKILLFITCFFIITLFFDQANLLDIIMGNDENIDIQHPEEVDASLVQSTPFLDQITFDKVIYSGISDINNATDAVILAKKVIVDEDSPFTETIFAVVPESGDAFENELQEDSYTFINIQSGIYLHNRTLLI